MAMCHAASLDGPVRRRFLSRSPQLELNTVGVTLRPPTIGQMVMCLIGAVVIAIADRAAVYASIGPLDSVLWTRAGKLFIVLLVLFWIGETLVTRQTVLNADSTTQRHSMRQRNGVIKWWRDHVVVRSCVFVAVLTVTVILCWMPYIRLMYPGLIWYDTGDQIAQFFGYPALGQPAGVVSSHHPVLDTMIFGAAAKAGELWLGGYQNGLSLLIVLQTVLMCLILAIATVYMRRVGAPLGTVSAVFLFFALFPALPIFFMSLVKDSVHAVVFMPWLLMYIEVCRSRLNALRSVSFTLGFVILSILSALTTATGLYITVLSMVGLPLLALPFVKQEDHISQTDADRRNRLTLRGIAAAVSVIVIVVIQFIFPALARDALNIHKEDPNQILVVPMQMTARYVLDHPSDVTAQEREIIDLLNNVPVEHMPESYNPFLADPILHLSLKDPSFIRQYMAVWVAQGRRHPDSYLNAFVALESGWFSLRRTPVSDLGPLSMEKLRELAPQAVANQMLIQTGNAISPPFAQMIEQSGRPQYQGNEKGQQSVKHIWTVVCSQPVLRWLTYTAVWSFILPMFLLFCTLRRPGRIIDSLVIAAPLIWSLLSLLPNAISVPLKPTASRYILWALYVVPVYVAMLRAASTHDDR